MRTRAAWLGEMSPPGKDRCEHLRDARDGAQRHLGQPKAPEHPVFFKITALLRKFAYPKMHLFKVYNPVVLSVFTELCNQPQNHLKHLITPKQTCTLAITPHFSSTSPAPGDH